MNHDHSRHDPDIDLEKATLARIYDFQLGGGHNFAVDREAARRLEQLAPGTTEKAWANRAFMHRAVRYCAEQGIDQFLDIGSGIPTVGNVHEIAQRVNPAARVVYVDIDPVAVIQSRTLLEGDDRSGVLVGDFRHPEAILDHPITRRLIDFQRPVAVLLIALLHVIPDRDHPKALLARLTAHAVPGSYLAISHFGPNYGTLEQIEAVLAWSQSTTTPGVSRTPEQIAALLGAFTAIEPGVVQMHEWRPDPDHRAGEASYGYAVVARKD